MNKSILELAQDFYKDRLDYIDQMLNDYTNGDYDKFEVKLRCLIEEAYIQGAINEREVQ